MLGVCFGCVVEGHSPPPPPLLLPPPPTHSFWKDKTLALEIPDKVSAAGSDEWLASSSLSLPLHLLFLYWLGAAIAPPPARNAPSHPPAGDKCDSASPCALEMAAALVEFLSIVTFDGFGHVEAARLDRRRDLAGREGRNFITFLKGQCNISVIYCDECGG